MALVAGTPDGTLRPGVRQPSSISQGNADPNEEVLKALDTYKKKDNSKGEPHARRMWVLALLTHSSRLIVVVRFKGVGNAPIMKQNMYKITATNRFQAVIQFLRKELGWQSGEPLVCDRVRCSGMRIELVSPVSVY